AWPANRKSASSMLVTRHGDPCGASQTRAWCGMRVSRIDHGLDNHLIVESDEPRAQGLHASDLYGALYRRLNPKRFRAEPPNPLLLALGLAWERYFQGVVEAAGLDITRPP